MVGQVAAENLAVVLEHLVGAEQQHVADSAGLIQCVLDAQTRLGGDQLRHVVQALADQRRSAVQDRSAFKPAELGHIGVGGGKGVAHLLERGFGHGADDFGGVGVVHRDHTVAAAVSADLAPGQAHAVEVVVKNELLNHGGLSLSGQGRRC